MSPTTPPMRTNTMAILALVFAFLFPLLGAIFGHVALGQIKRSGEEGKGLALAGVIVGWVFTGIATMYVLLVIVALSVSF